MSGGQGENPIGVHDRYGEDRGKAYQGVPLPSPAAFRLDFCISENSDYSTKVGNVNFDHVGTPYGGSITKTRPEFYFEKDVQHHLSIWEVKRKLPIQLFDDIYFFCLAARRPHTSMLDIHYQSWET